MLGLVATSGAGPSGHDKSLEVDEICLQTSLATSCAFTQFINMPLLR